MTIYVMKAHHHSYAEDFINCVNLQQLFFNGIDEQDYCQELKFVKNIYFDEFKEFSLEF